jgi:hypothetical protein
LEQFLDLVTVAVIGQHLVREQAQSSLPGALRLSYGVPYRYIGESVDVRLGDCTVEIFHDGLRLAVHSRQLENGKASTLPQHRTAAHRSYIERDADSFLVRAAAVGGNCAQAVKTILQNFPHPEMAFRSCEGILRLGRQHDNPALKSPACAVWRVAPCATGTSSRCSPTAWNTSGRRNPIRLPYATPTCGVPPTTARSQGGYPDDLRTD